MALIKSGDHEGGATMLFIADRLARQRQGPRDQEIRALARHGVLWLEIFGHPVCGRPDLASLCF